MRIAALAFVALILVGCKQSAEEAKTPATPTTPVAATPAPAIPEASVSSTTTQDPVGAEQTLRTLGVPIYHDATIDTAQHATSDEQGANAVFTTSATVKQVEYFYQSYPELKMTKANGSTLFSGSLNGVPVTLEVRPNKGKTEIIAQARKS